MGNALPIYRAIVEMDVFNVLGMVRSSLQYTNVAYKV